MRKLKLDKNFQPIPYDPGDELYPNGIFEFNITRLSAFIENNPNSFQVEEFEVKTIRFSKSYLDESAINMANLSVPIILAEISPEHFNVIDGRHRLEKAYREDRQEILGFRILAEQHVAFLTSVNAYIEYLKYWNRKLREGKAYRNPCTVRTP